MKVSHKAKLQKAKQFLSDNGLDKPITKPAPQPGAIGWRKRQVVELMKKWGPL